MNRTALSAAALLAILGLAAPSAIAAPCRDAHGKFTKCPPAKPTVATRCKDAKGRFAKCGTPGSRPAK